MNVLIVEDDASVAQSIEQLIMTWGHKVEVSDTGKDALKKFYQNTFDLVLLDIFLPDAKGYELIPKFKERCPRIDIVTMTGHNTRELESQIRKLGITFYMIKPVRSNDLKAIVDHISKNQVIELNVP